MSTVANVLRGLDQDTSIHLTPEAEAAFAAGVDRGTYFVRLGDVLSMSIAQYQADIVGGAAAAGPGQPVRGFITATPGTAGFAHAGSFNKAGTREYVNPQTFAHSGYMALPQSKGSRAMAYWVKRIVLKSGELVTGRELSREENLFSGLAPVVGDTLLVACRGRKFPAEVIWGSWPSQGQDDTTTIVPLRVREV